MYKGRIARFDRPGKPFEIETVSLPRVSPGEIPIKVGYERAAETTCTVNRVDAAVQPPAHRSAEHGRRIEKWRTR